MAGAPFQGCPETDKVLQRRLERNANRALLAGVNETGPTRAWELAYHITNHSRHGGNIGINTNQTEVVRLRDQVNHKP